MRKSFAMLLALVMCFTLATSAMAAETRTVVVGDVSVTFGAEGPKVMPRGVWAFRDECAGETNYRDSFTCYPQNGNNMDLTIDNNGSSDIIVNLTVDGERLSAQTVSAGDSETIEFKSTDQNEGLSCDVSINMTTDDGSPMYATITAWQYQVNP